MKLPVADTGKIAAVNMPVRTILMLSSPWLFGFTRPGGTLAGPGRERIPLGPPHPPLLTSDPHENKRRIVPAGLRTNEDRRNSVGIPDDCRICHFGSPVCPKLAQRPNSCTGAWQLTVVPLKDGYHSNQQYEEERYQQRWYEPLTNVEFVGI
ncbi:hypothetical protein ACQR0Z_15160 [Bradyrhizobium sp. HKCCYLS3077]|uniref:hypothetical protein n=1 Tax=Bradyrhizobium sp. HKCCYLS3077 TaxID=3420761 RepID=UPI003EC0B57B